MPPLFLQMIHQNINCITNKNDFLINFNIFHIFLSCLVLEIKMFKDFMYLGREREREQTHELGEGWSGRGGGKEFQADSH